MNVTHTTSLDQCPTGLVHVAAHGECPGGLAMKLVNGVVLAIDDTWRISWSIDPDETPDFEGVPLTPVPTETAAASTDPRVRAYVTGPHSTGRSGITISNNTKEQ